MPDIDKRIDEYIDKSKEFVKPVLRHIREAMQINNDGLKLPPRSQDEKIKKLETPSWFRSELEKNSNAKDHFDKLSTAHKREYLDWMMEPKKEETRQGRLAIALEWLSRGKSFNRKYEK
jgi:uncharacterized protein YdeI (YjbR/CyaY-like superfamily)